MLQHQQQQQRIHSPALMPRSQSAYSSGQSSEILPTKSTHSIWKEASLCPKNKEIPSARWGHSFVQANNDLLYLFGGYAESNYMNDSWNFDLNSFQWSALTTFGSVPEKRSNHSGCYLEKRNKILIFGGGGKEKKRFNDVHLLDINTNVWESLNISNGDLVTPRTYHTANLFFDQYLVIFGGEGVGDLNDLCILNLNEDPQWLLLQPLGKVPPKRRFHSSAAVQNKLYILGGCFSNYRCHDDIWELNIGDYLKKPQETALEWKQVIHYNHVFQPRWGQCSQVYDDKVYIFGGRNLKDLNETIIFDPSKQADCLVKIDQTSPNPRRRGAAVVVGSTIVVFGGFDGIYYNDIHYLNITQTETEATLKLDNEQHFKFLQNLMYSQQNYDLEIQFSSFKIGVHKIIVYERMNDPKNRAFLSKIETCDFLNLSHRDFEQRFFINTVVQYMYSGVFDYRQIRNQKDLNQLQEFAYEIKLKTLLEALNQNEQWIRLEIQQTLVQRFNAYYFQRYFRLKQHFKKPLSFINTEKKQKIEYPQEYKNKQIHSSSHISSKNYDPNFVIVNDQVWIEDNEIFYQYSDITLSCEGKLVRANRLLLQTQCLYFKMLFDSGFVEKSESVINIEVVSYEMLKIILNFIYFHKIVLPKCFEISDWMNLIEASKYFQIFTIQEICEIELIKLIHVDNLFNLYYCSILYNCQKLRQNCSQQFALKLYSSGILTKEQTMNEEEEDQIIQEMRKEAGLTYNLLKFQINQDKVLNESILIVEDQIDIEYTTQDACKDITEFLSEILSWEKQEEIIYRLKRKNPKQKSLLGFYNNNNSADRSLYSSSTQSCSNCDQLYLQLYDSNSHSQTTIHNYDSSGDNSYRNKQTPNFLSSDSDKFALNQPKCVSPLFQTQDFTVFSTNNNNYSQELQQHMGQHPTLNQSISCSKKKHQISLNSTMNYDNSLCLSGRSQDSIQYAAIQNASKTNMENCNTDFNGDSYEYDASNNAMIEETQTFAQFQSNMEYSH